MVSGRFWAFSFDMSGFVLAAVSLPSVIQKPLFVASGQQKSAVLLRRFCLAQKLEQGNAIPLSVVLFLFAYNRCANGCTAADKQQDNPQSKAACVAGLG